MIFTKRDALKFTLAISTLAALPAFAHDGPILIGATIPTTGPLSLTGKQCYNALQLAEEQINGGGGINGRSIRIVFEDTQASNGTAINAFVKILQEANPAFVFLSSYSTQNLAVAPEVQKSRIPVMYAGGADVVSSAAGGSMFRIRPADSLAAAGMVHFARSTLKTAKPGIIYIQNDFGQGGAQEVIRQFKLAGTSVVGIEAYGQNDKDFSAQILSLKQKGADTIFAFVYTQDGAMILRQAKMLGIKSPIVASSAVFVPAALQLLSPADLENVYGVVDAFVGPNVSERMTDFMTRYRGRFGVDADPFALAYYDGALLVAEGMRTVGTDPMALRNWLASVKNWPGIGHKFSFDSAGNGISDVAVVRAKPGTKDLDLVQSVTPN